MKPMPGLLNRFGYCLAVWLPVGGLLTALFVMTGGSSIAEGVVLAVPLATVYMFLCVGAGYSCRALPLSVGGTGKVLLIHLAAASLSSLLWVGLSRAVAMGLESMNLFPGAGERLIRQAGILFTLGLLLYLLAVAVHYLVAASAASRESRKRALEADIAAREAELRVLRAQIDPHFLFNSLNSISALVGRDPERARRMCASLGDLLRSSIQLGRLNSISLDDELSMVNRYLEIEKVRLGDRLDVAEQVEESTRQCLVPPFLLQPVMENALKHGIGNLLEGGIVTLSTDLREDRLWIVVDNPVDPEASPQPGTGTGLSNLRKRLRGVYGEDAVLRAGRDGARFRVEMSLPAVLGDSEDE